MAAHRNRVFRRNLDVRWCAMHHHRDGTEADKTRGAPAQSITDKTGVEDVFAGVRCAVERMLTSDCRGNATELVRQRRLSLPHSTCLRLLCRTQDVVHALLCEHRCQLTSIPLTPRHACPIRAPSSPFQSLAAAGADDDKTCMCVRRIR